ncbi:MAG: exosortase/archaeosortase family protein [Opitutae bacterium]|nr:exosortase/archaeosortase family protein [Opitutae bacterium]
MTNALPSASLRLAWFAPPLLWVVVPLAVFVLAVTLRLWPHWSHNPDLSHGFFMPLIFGLLLWEARNHGTPRWLPAGRLHLAAVASCLALALVTFALTGLLAASVGWSHALVNFVLTAALAAVLLAGLLVLSADNVRALPVNWISLTALSLWLLVAPIPPGTYARLTLGLQNSVTSGVLSALHLLGVPARQQGNIIELASVSVGVEEACSGIRSLLSCTYAGFFFAGWQVRGPGRRAFLIILAPLLAVVMNFLRSLALTLMANAGINIAGFWHDATGFAILGLTAVILGVLAMQLSPAREAVATAATPAAAGASRTPFRIFGAGSAAIAALALFFLFFARPATVPAAPSAGVETLLPTEAEGWQVNTTRDLYRFSEVLRTNQLAERTYLRVIDGQPTQLTVYVAYWAAGQAPVSLVASHTPDACWPGSGWTVQPTATTHPALVVDGRSLPPVEYRAFRGPGEYPQHVWFWHVYNGRAINYRDPYSVPALLGLALRYGFQREGDQYFIRISSNRPWEQFASEPLVRELFHRLARTGLKP